MFTALVLTRLLVETTLRSSLVTARPAVLGLAVGARFRRWIETRRPNLLAHSRCWLAVSAGLIVLALAGLLTRGLEFGIEFSGGRLIEYETARAVDPDRVRSAIADAGFPRTMVQESGEGNVSLRTPQLDAQGEERVRQAVESVAGPAEVVRDEFVGPTIGEELRRRAAIALGLALAAQLAYLAIRFRWTYGAAAVAAMFHDVTILLGVFAWLGKPADGVFLAALLTVIGYSINDSVVVFDRIRELRRRRPRQELASVANEACLQTVPRTINTGLGALFILVALFVLGGETLTDFALALLVGILVGTWSSVFTATPLAVLFERDAAALTQEPEPDRSSVLVPAAATREPTNGADLHRPTSDPPVVGERVARPARPSQPRPRKRKGGQRR